MVILGECWLWAKSTKDGYAVLWINGKRYRAHRVIYESLVGPIPEGLVLDHLCRVKQCVNPEHLEPVTHAENVRRGDSGKFQKSKTHCPRGHEYTPENNHIGRKGNYIMRGCRTCRNAARRKKYMITLAYAKCSEPSAKLIEAASGGRIKAVRSPNALINWGRSDVYDDALNSTINANKREMRNAFAMNGVPMPTLYTVGGIDWFAHGPLVGRPDHHTHGRGFWLIHNHQELARSLRGTRTKKAATHFMAYIEAEHEIRVHVFNGQSIRMSEKHIEGMRGNWKQYTTIKPTIDKQTRKKARIAAKQAVAAVGLDFGAVDILVDANSNVYVLEVNSAPGIGGSLPKLYADKFVEWSNQ